jgi:predicted nucleic acid-binding protein
MSGDEQRAPTKRVVVDTSVLVDYAKGIQAAADAVLGYEAHISIITEIEFLAWPGMSEDRRSDAHAFLREYSSNGISDFVRDYAAWLKRTTKLKTPDAVIAATAKYLNAPLLTTDKDFRKVAHLIEVRMV